MKRLLAILLLLVLTAGLVSCNKEDAPDGMVNAAAENATFYLYVPEAWVPRNELSAAYAPNNDGSNVNVTAYMMDELYTAQTYWENKASVELASVFTEFALVEAECGDTTLAGMEAKRYVYDASLGGTKYRFMQIITVAGNTTVYTLTYTAKTEQFSTHLEDVEDIRANFALK